MLSAQIYLHTKSLRSSHGAALPVRTSLQHHKSQNDIHMIAVAVLISRIHIFAYQTKVECVPIVHQICHQHCQTPRAAVS